MKKIFGLLFFGLMIIFTSCEEEEVNPDFDVIANAGSDQAVLTGEEVVLDGTATVDESGEGVQAEWEFVSVPTGSDAVIEDAGSIIARFTPDIAGEFMVTLNVENQYGQDSDNATVIVSESQPATVVEIIAESPDHQTLEAALVATELADALSGDGPFTVFAPTNIAFETLPDGILDDLLSDPEGTLTDILLYHVVGFAALSTDLVDNQDIETELGNKLTVEITGEQIFVNDTEIIVTDIETENGVVHVIDAVLLPTIEIGGDYNEDLALSPPFEYMVTSRTRIGNQSVLTIAPGTRLEFTRDASLIIRDGSTIMAEGKEQEPVIFTATEQTPRWWRGFNIRSSMSTNNSLNYVIMEYGGGDGFYSTHSTFANLVIGGRIPGYAARLQVNNSVFRHSEMQGLHLTSSSEMPGSENNTYTQNEKSPLFIAQSGMHFLDSESSFTGNNGNDHILVERAGSTSGNITWNKLDVPYRATQELDISETNVTIEAGAQFEFESGTG